jgi:hypothetical protein
MYGSPTIPTTDNDGCYNPGCRLLGNFWEGSRKVQKIGVGRYQQFRPVNSAPAILYDTFQIIIVDVGCLTNNRRYNSGCRLLGNFRESSRKVQKLCIGRYQQLLPSYMICISQSIIIIDA